MKFRVVVLAIATISLSFSQVAINAEAATVSADSFTASAQVDPQGGFLCKTMRLIHRGVLVFPN